MCPKFYYFYIFAEYLKNCYSGVGISVEKNNGLKLKYWSLSMNTGQATETRDDKISN